MPRRKGETTLLNILREVSILAGGVTGSEAVTRSDFVTDSRQRLNRLSRMVPYHIPGTMAPDRATHDLHEGKRDSRANSNGTGRSMARAQPSGAGSLETFYLPPARYIAAFCSSFV